MLIERLCLGCACAALADERRRFCPLPRERFFLGAHSDFSFIHLRSSLCGAGSHYGSASSSVANALWPFPWLRFIPCGIRFWPLAPSRGNVSLRPFQRARSSLLEHISKWKCPPETPYPHFKYNFGSFGYYGCFPRPLRLLISPQSPVSSQPYREIAVSVGACLLRALFSVQPCHYLLFHLIPSERRERICRIKMFFSFSKTI